MQRVERLSSVPVRIEHADADLVIDFTLDRVAVPRQPPLGVVACTQTLHDRAGLERFFPGAFLRWAQHHFAARVIDHLVMYDETSGFADVAEQLAQDGWGVTYIPNFAVSRAPNAARAQSEGMLTQMASLTHCVWGLRDRARWVLAVDPDEYVVCRRRGALSTALQAAESSGAVQVTLPQVVFPGTPDADDPRAAAEGPLGYYRHRYIRSCHVSSKALLPVAATLRHDIHLLGDWTTSRAATGVPRTKVDLDEVAGVSLQHYMEMRGGRGGINRCDKDARETSVDDFAANMSSSPVVCRDR